MSTKLKILSPLWAPPRPLIDTLNASIVGRCKTNNDYILLLFRFFSTTVIPTGRLEQLKIRIEFTVLLSTLIPIGRAVLRLSFHGPRKSLVPTTKENLL